MTCRTLVKNETAYVAVIVVEFARFDVGFLVVGQLLLA
jgi:hypothetical protein